MPELPEVETVVRDLRDELSGRTFTGATVLRADVWRTPLTEHLPELLPGQRVVTVDRRGKYILIELHTGDHLMVHLGMTGHLTVVDPDAPLHRHTHFRAGLDDGRELRFDDVRRFGRMAYGPRLELEAARVLPRLGLEPLAAGFSQEAFDALLRRTTRTVKAALLDQAGVAGLGNIYVDEACFLAGVRPTRRCHRLTRAERQKLRAAIQAVLVKAIANRGSSVDDYRDIWNAQGRHQEALQVYGRGGQACYTCGHVLRRTVLAGRTTVYCSHCQR
jgi:formamidopyrimidine-DNA glycosylase